MRIPPIRVRPGRLHFRLWRQVVYLDSGTAEGIGCEVGESESLISDDGASRHMTSSHDSMTNYHEYNGVVRTAGGDVLSIEGVGDIFVRFLSDSGAFGIQLMNVAFVPQLSHNLLSFYSLPPHILRYEKWCGVTVQVRSNYTS